MTEDDTPNSGLSKHDIDDKNDEDDNTILDSGIGCEDNNNMLNLNVRAKQEFVDKVDVFKGLTTFLVFYFLPKPIFE